MRCWIIFFKAYGTDGSEFVFPGPYEGNEILWKYLFEDVIEELNLRHLEVLGYQQVSRKTMIQIFPSLGTHD